MSKKRGMSIAEKREVMLDILHSANAPFLLKELEKLGAKRGVVEQTVKGAADWLVCAPAANREPGAAA